MLHLPDKHFIFHQVGSSGRVGGWNFSKYLICFGQQGSRVFPSFCSFGFAGVEGRKFSKCLVSVCLLGEQGSKSFLSVLIFSFLGGLDFSKCSALVVVEKEVKKYSKFFTLGWMVETPQEQNFHKFQRGKFLFLSFFHLS